MQSTLRRSDRACADDEGTGVSRQLDHVTWITSPSAVNIFAFVTWCATGYSWTLNHGWLGSCKCYRSLQRLYKCHVCVYTVSSVDMYTNYSIKKNNCQFIPFSIVLKCISQLVYKTCKINRTDRVGIKKFIRCPCDFQWFKYFQFWKGVWRCTYNLRKF